MTDVILILIGVVLGLLIGMVVMWVRMSRIMDKILNAANADTIAEIQENMRIRAEADQAIRYGRMIDGSGHWQALGIHPKGEGDNRGKDDAILS